MPIAGQVLKSARRQAGLSQAELARRSGVAQSTISDYERGAQQPSFASLNRLVEAMGLVLEVATRPREAWDDLPSTPGGELLRSRAADLVATGARLGATNLRVFGSVARGEDRESSDVDILIDLDPGVSLLGLARIQEAFEDLLGRPVDVVPASGLKDRLRERVLEEAIHIGAK